MEQLFLWCFTEDKLDWIGAITLWIGNFVLINKKSWKAFVVFGIGNLSYLVYWITKGEWVTAVLVFSFLCQNIWGVWKWYKEEHNGS